jgi:hypothetical protein
MRMNVWIVVVLGQPPRSETLITMMSNSSIVTSVTKVSHDPVGGQLDLLKLRRKHADQDVSNLELDNHVA